MDTKYLNISFECMYVHMYVTYVRICMGVRVKPMYIDQETNAQKAVIFRSGILFPQPKAFVH
jgi:hypothetical protein